ncbi:Na(+)/H(+) exchange regulatory cofactor NHE-RF2 isoform X1 [Salvelinus namaycush]|uniref:Na(+)/H(+) exchange regulatory cofactor NHE-RF2 isoform X1 n=1 Tax=Salvelinus namaycush TaxID=8040 RepID=A0A8U0QEB2_SALNM|nr:Na(+)/H(+) exchange regulatory cofactor NHE-RF2 isoform X1 [Salvelinus namaycush]
MASELKPRLCIMTKSENGYGFHLHGEKGKNGQYIRKVEPASSAEASGLRPGDRVIEVNRGNVEKDTHHQVVQRIKAVEQETRLLVVDRETDEYLRSLRLVCTEEMAVRLGGPTSVSPASPPASPPPSSPPASSPAAKRENGSVSKLPATLTREVPKPTRRSPSRAAKKVFLGLPLLLSPCGFQEALAHVNAHAEVARPPVDPSELFPRLCHLVRAETGYGFNLHSEKSRPGQYIRSLDPGSPADHAGLRPQDRLIEVNGVNVEGMRHAEVVAFIKRGGDETRLLVVDPDTDHHFKKMGVTPLASHVKDYDGPSISNGSPSPQINGSFTSRSIQSHHSDLSSPDNSLQLGEDEASRLMDPFAEIGLLLSPTAAEAKEKAHAKRAKKRAPQMDWDKKHQLFSNF